MQGCCGQHALRPTSRVQQHIVALPGRFEGTRLSYSGPPASARRAGRARAVAPLALVSVEFNPALLLGLGAISAGLALYQLRQREAAISRDKDLFISCVCLCSGGILVFQVGTLGSIHHCGGMLIHG